jgi:hypothetical protein
MSMTRNILPSYKNKNPVANLVQKSSVDETKGAQCNNAGFPNVRRIYKGM